MRKKYYICPYCLQELKSRGEEFHLLINAGFDGEEHTVCDFCEEEDDDLTPITF